MELRKLLAERLPVGYFDIVVDLGYREVSIVSQPEQLSDLVRTGRPVRVIPLGPLVARVRDAFKRVTASTSPAPDRKQQRRSSETG